MADMNKRGPDCNDCGDGEGGERGERGERGKRGKRGHDGCDGKDGHDGHDGPTGPTGPGGNGGGGGTGPTGPCCTGPTGMTGEPGPEGQPGTTNALFQFSGTLGVSVLGTAAPVAVSGSFADGGFASPAFPYTTLLPLSGPFPAYPVAHPQTISALAVNVFLLAPIVAGTVRFQLAIVPDDAAGPVTLIGDPVDFTGSLLSPLNLNTNYTERVAFAVAEVVNPGDRLALIVSSPDTSLTVSLLVSATAG